MIASRRQVPGFLVLLLISTGIAIPAFAKSPEVVMLAAADSSANGGNTASADGNAADVASECVDWWMETLELAYGWTVSHKGLRWTSEDGRLKLRFGGRIQADYGWYNGEQL
ncbi:MAG: hypothetical protein ACYTFO_02060, partial [Planctomycetota bacterium]